ncbi:conserved hypothetical protein [Ricinus communis]|uniref:Uncharacterized protein n=1 Tax=Ricinus communis TaxID=3988 RepID=B9RLE0_RICCO|nr:conserved hypothetical protein [Ricinus communis]
MHTDSHIVAGDYEDSGPVPSFDCKSTADCKEPRIVGGKASHMVAGDYENRLGPVISFNCRRTSDCKGKKCLCDHCTCQNLRCRCILSGPSSGEEEASRH